MSTFVLVHGSMHGGWCWEKIVPQLVQAGHKVVALDLPGHGEDTTPISEITLQSYVDTVVKVIDTRKEPVILVGHSFAGLIISQAAEARPEKVRSLVYLSALLLQDGQSAIQQMDPNSPVAQYAIINEQEGWIFMKEEALPFLYYNDCSEADIQAAKARLVKEPLRPYLDPVHLTAERFGSVPRVYIECLLDNAVTPEMAKQLYTQIPCQVISLQTSHSPFLSAPQELAQILDGIAQQVQTV